MDQLQRGLLKSLPKSHEAQQYRWATAVTTEIVFTTKVVGGMHRDRCQKKKKWASDLCVVLLVLAFLPILLEALAQSLLGDSQH